MAWQIKQKPGDFVVMEILEDEIESRWKNKIRQLHGKKIQKGSERFLWFTMKKTGTDFFMAVEMIARGLGISTKLVSYAGTKDKRAITYQTISIEGMKEEDIRNLNIRGLEFSNFRYRNRPVKLGEHECNKFIITVRNIEKNELKMAKERIEKIRNYGIINFFGEQRFGTVRGANHVIGKQILLGKIPKNLKKTPTMMLKLFVHAYQAYIWNTTALKLIKSQKHGQMEQLEIPIVGYATNLNPGKYSRVKGIIAGIMKKEKITLSDFKIRRSPKLSSKGSARDLICFPKRLSCAFERDDVNRGKMKMILSFELGKGSYATELVRQIGRTAP